MNTVRALLVLLVIAMTSNARAGVFQEAAVLDDSAVITGVQQLGAYNFSSSFTSPQIVNGVTFTGPSAPGTLSGIISGSSTVGTAQPVGVGDAFYDVLQETVYGIGGGTVVYSGVEAGRDYVLQVFAGESGVRRVMNVIIDGVGNDLVTYEDATGSGWQIGAAGLAGNDDTDPVDSGVESAWEVLNYSFTATSNGDLTVEFVDTFAAHLSAVSLVEVPEPASLALMAVGGLLLVRRRRRA
jgi:hypothetical protein